MTTGIEQTIAEKILSAHNVAGKSVAAGDTIDARVDGLMIINYGGLRSAYRAMGYPDGPPTVFDPGKVYVMNDHVQPPPDVASARNNYESKLDAGRLRIKNFYESEMGICHQMMLDYGHIGPGELIVGADSHTISYGALNTAATGIGIDEAAYVLAFGELFFTVPETIRIEVKGSNRHYPFAKDLILYLAGQYGDDFASGRSIEYCGPLAHAMSMDSRLTMADHAVEVGAKFAFFDFDDTAARYLKGRPEATGVRSDPGAKYEKLIELDADQLGFQVARPYRFDNVAPVEEVAGTKIDQARLGSCANGRFEDIQVAAQILKGRRVSPHVRFYVSPSSITEYKRCIDAGLISVLLEAGAQVDRPGCSICQSPGIVLNEEVCISSTTRNYRGRFGGSTCSEAEVYLAGPATVAASAVAGEIVDPTEFLE